jgi:hypothetical protein
MRFLKYIMQQVKFKMIEMNNKLLNEFVVKEKTGSDGKEMHFYDW